jgi:hypothetical protein
MPIQLVTVTQVCRIVRRTIVAVDAASPQAAVEQVEANDPPHYDLPIWTEYVELLDQQQRIATDSDIGDLLARSRGGPEQRPTVAFAPRVDMTEAETDAFCARPIEPSSGLYLMRYGEEAA